jgi:hypothetical protein
MGGCAAGEQRTFTASPDRGQVPGFETWCGMPNPVNAAVNANQAAYTYSMPDLCARDSGREQLLARDDTVCSTAERGKNRFDRGRLGSHCDP